MSSGIYLEAESSGHHIIFCDPGYQDGDEVFSDKAFIHLKSGRSLLPYIRVHELINVPPSYIKNFFGRADKLNSDTSLDEYLSRFIPLSYIDKDALPGYNNYAHGKSSQGEGSAPLSLADVTSSYFSSGDQVNDWLKFKHWLQSHEVSRGQEQLQKDKLLNLIEGKMRDSRVIGEYAFASDSITDTTYLSIASTLSSLSLFDLNETKRPFRRLLSGLLFTNRSSHFTANIWPNITAPHLADDLPPEHPAFEGLYRITFGKNPHLSKEEIMSSGILNGSLGYGEYPSNSPITTHSDPQTINQIIRGNSAQVINFIMGNNDIEQRNAFQTLKAFSFNPGLLQGKSLSRNNLSHYARDIALGANPSKLLYKITRDYIDNNLPQELQPKKDKFSKRDFNILSHNIIAQNKVLHAGKPATFSTLEGETLDVRPYSRTEIIEKHKDWGGGANMRESMKMAEVTLRDQDGNAIFNGLTKCETFNQGMALIVTDMPKGTLTNSSHLRVLETLANNQEFKKKLSSGFMMLRDNQLNKVSEYRGVWQSLVAGVDRVLDGSELFIEGRNKLTISKSLQKYESATYVKDGEWIMHTLSTAIAIHHLKKQGVPLDSKFRDLEDLSDNMEDNDLEFIIIDDNVFDASKGADKHRMASPFSPRYPGINHAIAASDKLHKGYSSLIAEAGPNIKASWPVCLPEISINLPSGQIATIKPITSYMDVRREGREQDHCLGSYGTRCLRREYEAFQVLVDGEHTATLGMDCDGDTLSFDQLQGYGNSAVSPELDAAIKEFSETLENEGEYDGNEVMIEPADSDDLNLGDDDLISLQIDVDISNESSIAKCREFLVERIGEDATRDLVVSSIQTLRAHYEELHLMELDQWEEDHPESEGPAPCEVPYGYELVERARRAAEGDFSRNTSLTQDTYAI